jgi:hypothetical protein
VSASPLGSAAVPSDVQIPDDLRAALDEAAGLLYDWTRGGPEPEVSLNRRPISMGAIFRLVTAFSDRAADDEYKFALLAAQTIRSSNHAAGHACSDPKDDTYASIAQCYLGLLAAARITIEVDKALRRAVALRRFPSYDMQCFVFLDGVSRWGKRSNHHEREYLMSRPSFLV